MALTTMKWPDREPERPWDNDLGFNNPRKITAWQAFERESIIQRAALGIELNAEEQRILDELERGHNRVVAPSPVIDPVEEPPEPEPRKRRRKKKTSVMRQAIERRKDESALFD